MSRQPGETVKDIGVMQAIAGRRSVRAYTSETLSRDTITKLLDAAVLAPTAMHMEPWAFAVIQDRALLHKLSDAAHAAMDETTRAHADAVFTPGFNIFYDAGTLIAICARPSNPFVAADCWLAAQNLMLAAYAAGLGTCVIGFAVQVLNLAATKERLGIPPDMQVFAPLIVGVPRGDTAPVPRRPPQILAWK
ncbi:MAG: nitroreductase family protein [Gammaproteobacteria bacterium]